MEKGKEEKRENIIFGLILFIGFILICAIGGLVYQFKNEIVLFWESLDERMTTFYQNAPPFVKGFLITAGLILVAVFIVLTIVILAITMN